MPLRNTISLGFDDKEILDTMRRLENVLKELDTPEKKLPILRKQARKIAKAAQKMAPRGKRTNFLYDTPKLLANRRAKNGFGRKKATILQGNLASSIRTLSLRRARSIYVGPVILKRIRSGSVFGPSNPNAYYAQMVYGSARAFRNQVMIPALNQTKSAIIKGLGISIKRKVRELAKKNKVA